MKVQILGTQLKKNILNQTFSKSYKTSMGIRASLEKKTDSKPRPTSALLDTKKVKKQSTLLKGAIKRKTR